MVSSIGESKRWCATHAHRHTSIRDPHRSLLSELGTFSILFRQLRGRRKQSNKMNGQTRNAQYNPFTLAQGRQSLTQATLQNGCSSSPNPKSQLVRYPNRETMMNNDEQWWTMMNNDVLLFSATNEETPYEQLPHYLQKWERKWVRIILLF